MFIKKNDFFFFNIYELLKKQKFMFSHYIEGKNDNFKKQINEEYARVQRNIPLNENDILKIRNVMIRIGNDKNILSSIIHTYNIPSFFLFDKDVRNHFLNYIKDDISYADQLRNSILMNNDIEENKDDNFLNVQVKNNNEKIKTDNYFNILNLYNYSNQNYTTTPPNQIHNNNNNDNNNYCSDKHNIHITKEKLKRSDEIIINILLIFIKKYYYKQWMFYEHIKRLCDYREINLYIKNKNKKQGRNIHLYVGPPNSGKTYHAFQKLVSSKNGLYCSPLRLLAWEVYYKLTRMNKKVNLLTGQEIIIKDNNDNQHVNIINNHVNQHYDIINDHVNQCDNNQCDNNQCDNNQCDNNQCDNNQCDNNQCDNNQCNNYQCKNYHHDDVTHTVCTIEMTPLNKEYDCAVVDEIQMINNESRGHAWTNVLMNLNCKDIYLCGSEYIIDLIKNLADIFNDQLIIKKFERLGSLQLQEYNTTLENVETGDCIITFSRNNIMLLKRILEKYNKRVFVIYGSLPPNLKKKQINMFNECCKNHMCQTDETRHRDSKHHQHNVYLLYKKKIEEYKIKIDTYKQKLNKYKHNSNMNKYYDSISYYKNILRKYFHCVKKYKHHEKKKKETVLIATDVIGMGLNINIKRIIFYSLKKFDGDVLRYLTISEFLQIAGRAGRFNPSSENKSIGYITCVHLDDINILKTIFKHKYINSLNYISTGDIQLGAKELSQSHSDQLHNINNILNIQYSTLLDIYHMITKERNRKDVQIDVSNEINDIYNRDKIKLGIIKNIHNKNNVSNNDDNDYDDFIFTRNFTNNYQAKAGFFPNYHTVEELRKTLEYEYNSKIKLHEILKILVDYVKLNDEYFFLTKNYNNMIIITKELEHINLQENILFTYSLCPININNIILLNTLKTFCMCHSILGYVDFFQCVNNNIFSHIHGNKYLDLLNNETNSNSTTNNSISYGNIQTDNNINNKFINQYDEYLNENVISNINYIDNNNNNNYYNNNYDISTNSFYFNKKIDIDNHLHIQSLWEHNEGEIKSINTQNNNHDNIIHIDEYIQLLEIYYEIMDMYCWLYTKFPDIYKNINLITNEKNKVSMKIIHMLTHTFNENKQVC
ncbi:ATP dependent DEAD-box helicase, putative [Plasmodium sp. gorilla clade G3]|nr:ATP dependent DEAD-box helicase, putative [Plasmodium sp. gorilla clade G3]